uniref:Uncharacterized protein n=1 Tax=Anguilla anguilla TaxID=7936 RepID=A0A0E9SCN5_ANGAN
MDMIYTVGKRFRKQLVKFLSSLHLLEKFM